MEDLPIMTNKIFLKTLPSKTRALLNEFQQKKPDFLNNFYLSGGTGLSLQMGHRQSEDLDFFSQKEFDSPKVQQELQKFGKLKHTELSNDTLNTYLNDVKLQFLEYPYQLIKPTTNWEDIHLSSVEDIACTKLLTISMRGSKKDFIDLYFLLQIYSLDKIFEMMAKKYQDIGYNQLHIAKSLVYFEDARQEPMPRMLQEVSWDDVEKSIIENVKKLAL